MNSVPRVLMIVDNSVEGDSRVQKSARSMAESGWNVLLLGRAPSSDPVTYALGGAQVHLAVMPREWDMRKRRSPGVNLRYPLAYTDRDILAERNLRNAFRRLDLQARIGEKGSASIPHRLRVKVARVVHRVRARQFRKSLAHATKVRTKAGLPWVGRSGWANDDPMLAELELAYAPVIDQFKPHLIHAHDYRSIGIAVRAADRIARSGARPPVIYDAHEFLPGVGLPDAKRRRGLERNEALHLKRADAIVTVGDGVADRLVEAHKLTTRPMIVLNAPPAEMADIPSDIRTDCGLAEGVPIVVYCGASAERRGLDVMIEALPRLPDVHVALLTKANAYTAALEKRAAELGAADRVHVLAYVQPEAVSAYLRTADVGCSPLLSTLNHELALPTKMFEYAHAGLPMLTSDVAATSEMVRRHKIGEVFRKSDVDDYVEALSRILADPDSYRYDESLLSEWTWEAQSAPVSGLYRSLLGRGPNQELDEPDDPEVPDRDNGSLSSADDDFVLADESLDLAVDEFADE